MTFNNRCYSCMEILPEGHSVCPSCGSRVQQNRTDPDVLEEGSILAARYLLGCAMNRTNSAIRYIGYDYEQNRKVIIEEQYFRGVFSRDTGHGEVRFYGSDAAAAEQAKSAALASLRRAGELGRIDGFAQVLNSFEENGTVYTVLEWVDGQPLSISGIQRCDPDVAADFLHPVARALSQLHQKGLCHGDLSMDSVYITPQGRTVIVGMGVGAAVFRKNHTPRDGGSAAYSAAPETKPGSGNRAGDIGPASDVYGLSAVVYELVTGEKPYPMATLPQSISCSPKQRDAIAAGLNTSPAKRPKSINAFMDKLTVRSAAAAKKQAVPPSGENTQMVRPSKRGGWKKLFALGAVLTVLGVLLIVFAPRPVVVDEGFESGIMPAITGVDVNNAQQLLDEHFQGLVMLTVSGKEYNETVAPNAIIRQEPAAGQTVYAGDTVYVYISRGPESGPDSPVNLRMPNLIAEEEAFAVELLEKYGIQVDIVRDYSNMYAEGLVMAQSIEPETPLSEGMSVTLTISQGKKPVANMPLNPGNSKPGSNGGTGSDKPADGGDEGLISPGNAFKAP